MPEYKKLRFAEEKDIKSVLVMLLKFIIESPYKDDEVEPEVILKMLEEHLKGPKDEKMFLVAVNEDDIPIGVLLCLITNHIFNKTLVANELIWWVEHEYRKSKAGIDLIEAFEFWGKKLKVSQLKMSTCEGPMRRLIERFYKSKKYSFVEKYFVKDL